MPGSNKAVAFVRDAATSVWRLLASGMKSLPDGLRVLADVLKSVRDIVISAAVIFAVVFCVMVVMRQVWRAPPMLEPIDLPQSLIANGLTREDITDRILAQVTALRQQADGMMETRSTPRPPRPAHLIFGSHGNAAPAPGFVSALGEMGRDGEKKSIDIPETGISVDAVADQARDLVGFDRLRFSGEIMAVESCPNKQGKGFAIELREKKKGRLDLMPNCETGPNALDAIVYDAAMDIASVTEPTVAEMILYNINKELSVSVARRVVTSDYPDTVRARAHAVIGSIYADSRLYGPAASEFRQAANLDADQAFIYNRNLCEVLGYDSATPLDTALGYCRKALEGDAGHAITFAAMGNVYLVRRKCGDAIASYEQALRTGDDHSPPAMATTARNLALAHDCKAWQFDDASKPFDALREFKLAAAIDPFNPYTYDDMGSLLLDMNQEPAAREALVKAANLAPANGQLLVSIAVDFHTGPHPDEAMAYFQRAFLNDRLGAEAAVARLVTGLSAKNQFTAAQDVLQAALKGAPADTLLHQELAEVDEHLRGTAPAK